MLLWLEFIFCTSAIFYSGTRLARYGDIIAEKTGMGRTWIGLILLATVTSLPELVTGISSVALVKVPDIAAGDILGSCVFNLLILAFLDIFSRSMPLSARVHHGHILSGGICIFLLSIVAASLYLGENLPGIGWIGIYSLVILVVYFLAMKFIYIFEKRQHAAYIKGVVIEKKYENIEKRTAYRNYFLNALIVIAAGVFLPWIGVGLAEQTGLGQTFVGNIFIALATSLPEVVVSVMALKLDAANLAIGGLLGSNVFNVMILALDDLMFIKGPLLNFTSHNHILSALSAIAMTTVAIIGLTYRAARKSFFLAWDSLVMVVIFLINMMLLYMM